MDIVFEKQPTKYLKSLDKPTRDKIMKAIEKLKEGKGDILKIKTTNLYRLKIPQYRIGFKPSDDGENIIITLIRPRGDFYKHIKGVI